MEDHFNQIAKELIQEYDRVTPGNMMRSPALSFQKKVFAFYWNKQMVFKLDHQAGLQMENFPGSSFLNPFKNKPPMKGWLVVPATHHKDWKLLTEMAYENICSVTKP